MRNTVITAIFLIVFLALSTSTAIGKDCDYSCITGEYYSLVATYIGDSVKDFPEEDFIVFLKKNAGGCSFRLEHKKELTSTRISLLTKNRKCKKKFDELISKFFKKKTKK